MLGLASAEKIRLSLPKELGDWGACPRAAPWGPLVNAWKLCNFVLFIALEQFKTALILCSETNYSQRVCQFSFFFLVSNGRNYFRVIT